MGMFDGIRKAISFRSRSEPVSQEDFANLLGGGPTWANISVDRIDILGLPVLWACVRVLSEGLASFPLVLYEGTAEGETREKAVDHPLYDLLHDAPNPNQDAFSFKDQLQGHLCLYGNAYANIVYGGSGYPEELWPLDPDKVTPKRVNGRIIYLYRDGTSDRIIQADDMFHISGFSFDGIRGYCPLDLQRQTFGLAVAARRYAAEFFANNGTPDLALVHPAKLSEVAVKRLRDSWVQNHSKWGKKHAPAILEEGMDIKQLSLSPENVQLIATQKFLTTEICRMYRVAPHLVQDLERATFSNIEHQSIEFATYTMRPWVMRWEAAISRQLLNKKDRKNFYPEFSMDAILRGDMTARASVYASMIGVGILSPNEARRKEQWNDREGGDTYYVPLNWVDSTAEKVPPESPPPVAPVVPSGDETKSAHVETETRTLRSAKSRKSISNSFSILVRDAAARIVRKEKHDIQKAASDTLKQRSASDFTLWLDKYYRDLPEYIKKQVTPVFQAFSNAIRTEISNELEIDDVMQASDEQFVRDFVDAFAKRYIGDSTAKLGDIIKSAGVDNLVDNLSAQLDEWEEKRADKVALNEKTQASNAFAKNIYRLAGIITLTWVALGRNTCAYCSQMDGRSTSINDDFVYKGEELPDERGMTFNRGLGHPPLHVGCECQIMASGAGRSAI